MLLALGKAERFTSEFPAEQKTSSAHKDNYTWENWLSRRKFLA
jgi:hypothetical protein